MTPTIIITLASDSLVVESVIIDGEKWGIRSFRPSTRSMLRAALDLMRDDVREVNADRLEEEIKNAVTYEP